MADAPQWPIDYLLSHCDAVEREGEDRRIKAELRQQQIQAKQTVSGYFTALAVRPKVQFLLSKVQAIVKAIRLTDINVICLPNYDPITNAATGMSEGSFTVKTSTGFDLLINHHQCQKMSEILGISLSSIWESVLAHEFGHCLAASIKPEYMTSENAAWALG